MDTTYWARFDSNSANNPALNLRGDPAVEITFVNQTPTGGLGDYHLDQPTGGGIDPDTLVSIGGTTYTFVFEFAGTLPTLNKHGAGKVPDQFEGNAVYVITVQDYPSPGQTARLAFLPDDNATAAEMNAFGQGAINIQNLDTTPPPSPVCYLAGTPIDTPAGPVAVETLTRGDLVRTLDAGWQRIRWTGRTVLRWPGASPDGKPVLIRAGALGNGLPETDLAVSPQHRMLLSGDAVARATGHAEVFVPAKALVGRAGIRQMAGRRKAEYCHLMLDRHHVLTAAGTLSESFYPGPGAMSALSQAARVGLFHSYPALLAGTEAGFGTLARPALTVQAAIRLVQRMADAALVSPATDSVRARSA